MNDKSKERAKKVSALINKVKDTFQQKFTLKQLTDEFRNHKVPYASQVVTLLKNLGLIYTTSPRGEYEFFDCGKPIFHGDILAGLDEISAKHAKSVDKYRKKEGLSEQQAINLLKSKGYKILKPITQFEEI